MGKGRAKQEVVRYRMSIHLGVCVSADAVTGVRVNEKIAWTGRSTALEDITINQPELFGGVKKEGGLVGIMTHLPGRSDQVLPEWIAQRFGRTAATAPAYRSITSLFFSGGGVGGFSWSFNNPIIAQSIDVEVERAPKGLDPALAMIGRDANPAHIICECLTDDDWGMGDPLSSIDMAAFGYAAQTLYDEGFGLSFVWTRQTTIEALISEVLDHIQATLYQNPRNGLWTLRLLRDDYDPTTLRTINPDNATLTNFQRRLWGEAGNTVIVTYTDAETGEDASVTAHDLGALYNQGGAPVPVSRDYYAIHNPELAMKVAQRDARTVSAPLASATAELDRSMWDVRPGDVFKLTWPEYKVFGLVVRALTVDSGQRGDSVLKVPLLEDIFALERGGDSAPPGTVWEDPSKIPQPVDATEIITLPAYFAASADLQTAAVDLEYPEVLAGVLAYTEAKDVRSYELMSEDVTSSGETVWRSHGSKTIVERTVLPTALPWDVQSRLADILIFNKARGPQVGGFVFIGVGADAGIEIGHVTAFDAGSQEWIIARGCLDTVPRTWPAGTPVWFVNPGQNIVDEAQLRSAGETVEYRLRPRTSLGILDLADAPVVADVLTGRPHLPLRPANVKLNGISSGVVNGAGLSTFALTWATRNRLLEDGQVFTWETGPVAPEYRQGTVVTVFDHLGNNVYEQWGLWTESGLDLPAPWFARFPSVTIRVSSRRDDLDSLQAHSFQVTGLPANPSAPYPPAPPVPGAPPSPDPAPAEGAWAATGSMFTLDQDGKVVAAIPAILVSGQRERPDAIGLIVRYAKTSGNDWFYLPEVALSDAPTQSATTAVSAQTEYKVEVAYRSDKNILSNWRSLGTVVTGSVIAQALEDLTAEYVRLKLAEIEGKIAEVLEDFDEVSGIIDSFPGGLTDTLNQYGLDIGAAAEAIIERSLDNANLKVYLDSLAHVDGVTVKSLVVENIEQTDDLVAMLNAIIVRDGDASSTLVRYDKVQTEPGVTLAQSLTQLQSSIADNTALISANYLTLVNADEALAASIMQLSSDFGDFQALVAVTYATQANLTSALATYDLTIKAWVNDPMLNTLAATVSAKATALATLEGNVYARYVLEANANGNIARMTLLTAGGAIPTSTILFEADNFMVRSATNPAKKPFYYDASSGTLYSDTITVRNANIESASITRLKIAGGTVTAGAASSATSETTVAAGNTVSLASISFTTYGGRVRISFSCYLNPITWAASSGDPTQVQVVTLRVRRNGSVVRSIRSGVAVKIAPTQYFLPGGMLSFLFSETPPAGTHTYDVVAYVETTPTSAGFADPDLHALVTER